MIIKLLPHQYKAVYSPYKHTMLSGGVGSGKTFAGTQFVIKNLAEQPGVTGLICANTYQQLRDVSVMALLNQLSEYKIPFQYNKNEMTVTVGDTIILCRSAEKHEFWKGIEIGWYWFDEAAYARKAAYETIVARLRIPKATRHHGLITSTPKGYNWCYNYFAGDQKTDEHHLVTASTKANKHLPDDFEQSIRAQFDDLLAAQELEGSFVNVTAGKIYYSFDRETHVKPCEYNPRFPIYAGVDFNVDPMTATLGQLIDGVLYVFDEVYLRNSNTPALGATIQSKYGLKPILIPDSTGNKRSTASATSLSDIQILSKMGFKVKPGLNPYRIDRYAAVNGALANKKIVISPQCKYTIKDLESVTYKEGSDKPDTTDKLLTHASDNLGYMIYKTINPLRGSIKKISSQTR